MAKPQSFKKGDPRINRKGAPKKGYSITEMMRGMLTDDPEIKAALGKSVIKKALSGDMTAMKIVWNYMDGLPPQPIGSFDEDGKFKEQNLTIEFVKVKK